MPHPDTIYHSPFYPNCTGKEMDPELRDHFTPTQKLPKQLDDQGELKEVIAELREIRLLLQQVIGLPDTPITRAVKEAEKPNPTP